MFGKFKNLLGLGSEIEYSRLKPSNIDDSGTSSYLESVTFEDTNDNEQNKIQILKVNDTVDDLKNVKCICIKCGEDFTRDIMSGETEVLKVHFRNSKTLEGTRDMSNTMLSPEGYCLDCEIKIFPDRFHGCAFCRRPLRNLFACTTCRIGFADWIKDVVPPETIILKSVREKAQQIVSGIIESGFIENREFIYRESQLMSRWPGFYAGLLNINKNGQNNSVYLPTWIVPDYLNIPEDTKSVNVSTDLTKLAKFKLFEQKLREILEFNNINIYQNIQINLTKMSRNNIREINPYDTSVLK